MTVLVVEDAGPEAVGGAALRWRALAAGLARHGPLDIVETASLSCSCADAPDPDPYADHYCRHASAALVDGLRAEPGRPVLVSHLRLHRYFTDLVDAGMVHVGLDLHSVESDLYADVLTHPLAARAGATTAGEVAALRDIEAAVIPRAAVVTVPSTVDRDRIARYRPTAVHVVPNAVRVPPVAPAADLPGGPHLLFLGDLSYFPNLHAATVLAQQVLPLARKVLPGCTLTLAGRRPPPMLTELASAAGATLVPDPADAAALLAGRVLVVPLRYGGGTRLKILEAFAAGTPVISSAKGIEGIDAVPGRHYLAAESPAAVVAALVRLPAFAGRSGARDLVRRAYSWESVADALTPVLEHLR